MFLELNLRKNLLKRLPIYYVNSPMDQSMIMLVNGGYTQLHQSGYMSVLGRYVLIFCVSVLCVRVGVGAGGWGWGGRWFVYVYLCLSMLCASVCVCVCVCVCKFMLLYRWVAIEYLGEPGNSFRRFLQNSAVNLGEVTLHNGVIVLLCTCVGAFFRGGWGGEDMLFRTVDIIICFEFFVYWQNEVVALDSFHPKEVTVQDQEAGLFTTSQFPTQAVRMVSGDSPSCFPSQSQDLRNTATQCTFSRNDSFKEESEQSTVFNKRAKLLEDDDRKDLPSSKVHLRDPINLNAIGDNITKDNGEVSHAVPDVAAAIEDLLEQTIKVKNGDDSFISWLIINFVGWLILLPVLFVRFMIRIHQEGLGVIKMYPYIVIVLYTYFTYCQFQISFSP